MYIIDMILFKVLLQNNFVKKLVVIVIFLRADRKRFLAFPQLPPAFLGLWASHPRGRDGLFFSFHFSRISVPVYLIFLRLLSIELL